MGALEGLRVVEVGEFISAPYCGKLLADLGAEVLKVEPPGGDRARRYGPFRGDIPDAEASGLFVYLNTNKRGVTLDVAQPSGRALLGRLLASADLLVEAVEPAQVHDWGLDWGRVHEEHPGLIVTSISTFGRSGPYAEYRGFGLQASAGSTVAQRTGDPARSPLGKPLNEPEFLGGVHGAAASLVATFFQRRGGTAQHIDISTQGLLASVTSGPAMMSILFGTRSLGSRSGHRVPAFFPWTVLPVADGHMEFVTMQERHWQQFLNEVGNPGWAKEARFQDIWSRAPHAEELEGHMVAAMEGRTKADLWKAFRARKISFQPVHTVDEVVEADQLAERGYFEEVLDGNGQPMTVPGAPYRLSGTPWEVRRGASRLGEHNAEVFGGELGLGGAELVDLRRTGVI